MASQVKTASHGVQVEGDFDNTNTGKQTALPVPDIASSCLKRPGTLWWSARAGCSPPSQTRGSEGVEEGERSPGREGALGLHGWWLVAGTCPVGVGDKPPEHPLPHSRTLDGCKKL